MDAIAQIFLQIIKFLHGFTGNYGWDIILLTVLIRVVMFPLTLTSLKSMKGMQELQPKIKELQKKYADDKERLNKELMALYKQGGINPISGCLPMLIQLPIFIILYNLLRNSEANGYIFVNASFYGMDLMTAAFNKVSPDFLGNVRLVVPGMIDMNRVGIPFFNNAYLYIPTFVLVIFMGITTFVQQRSMKMEQSQASTFIMMNVFIVFISFTMPAGVLLYWTMSNFFQIIQQKYTPSPTKPADAKTDKKESAGKASKESKTAKNGSGAEKNAAPQQKNNRPPQKPPQQKKKKRKKRK